MGSNSLVNHRSFRVYALLGFSILSVTLIRLRLLDFPLERDEGEYAYMGQLILESIPPYEMGYNMKLPGTYYMYAVLMWLFGETTSGIHLGLLVCNAITMILVFGVARELMPMEVAAIASLLYGWIAASATVLGFAAHATHFVILMGMGGTWLLIKAQKRGKPILFLLAGIFLSLAYVMKQHGVFFILMGQAMIIWCNDKRDAKSIGKASLWFISGVIFTILMLYFAMYVSGVWEKFWYWTVTYAMDYANQFSLASALSAFLFGMWYITRSFFLVWVFSLAGLISLIAARKSSGNDEARWLLLFIIFSFLTVVPGFYFRPHYFITFLPAVSMLAALGARRLFALVKKEKLATSLYYGSILFSILIGIFIERKYFLFEKSSQALSYAVYSTVNAFPDMKTAGKVIKANTNHGDKIFVFGSEPQIYFYADRVAATGYLYMYPFVENHSGSQHMQMEMIREVESANPDVLVFVNTLGSLSNKTERLRELLSWFEKYSRSDFEEIGIIDVVSDKKQVVRLGNEAKNYVPVSDSFIKIFKRRIAR